MRRGRKRKKKKTKSINLPVQKRSPIKLNKRTQTN